MITIICLTLITVITLALYRDIIVTHARIDMLELVHKKANQMIESSRSHGLSEEYGWQYLYALYNDKTNWRQYFQLTKSTAAQFYPLLYRQATW